MIKRQYYGDPRQKCRLNGFEMRDLFRDFVKAIKNHLPNAQISWDISSWLYREEFCEWYYNSTIYQIRSITIIY